MVMLAAAAAAVAAVLAAVHAATRTAFAAFVTVILTLFINDSRSACRKCDTPIALVRPAECASSSAFQVSFTVPLP